MKRIMYPLAMLMAAVALLGSSVPLRASETDTRIESSFMKTYVYRTFLKEDHIKIDSKDGAVTLTGDVNGETHKVLAKLTAESMSGVTTVDNRIEIKGDNPIENSDAWVNMKVKTVLLFHRNVNALKTDVDVKDGIVTLKGEAADPAQKNLTAEYTKDIVGVKDVKNDMTVSLKPEKPVETMSETMDDASITAQVKMTLLLHRSTSIIDTKVTTTDGTVTLTGKTRSDAEKEQASKLVKAVRGVKSVVNNMTIE